MCSSKVINFNEVLTILENLSNLYWFLKILIIEGNYLCWPYSTINFFLVQIYFQMLSTCEEEWCRKCLVGIVLWTQSQGCKYEERMDRMCRNPCRLKSVWRVLFDVTIPVIPANFIQTRTKMENKIQYLVLIWIHQTYETLNHCITSLPKIVC